jgi:hypothetical protein
MFALSSDDDWIGGADNQGKQLFSRLLMVASPKRILDHNPDFRPLHDGIEDCLEGKASSIYYFEKGRVLELMGAD